MGIALLAKGENSLFVLSLFFYQQTLIENFLLGRGRWAGISPVGSPHNKHTATMELPVTPGPAKIEAERLSFREQRSKPG
jgi:hypothetical protein